MSKRRERVAGRYAVVVVGELVLLTTQDPGEKDCSRLKSTISLPGPSRWLLHSRDQWPERIGGLGISELWSFQGNFRNLEFCANLLSLKKVNN